MLNLSAPDKQRLSAKIKAIIAELGDEPTFVSAIEKVYASGHILLTEELQQNKRKLSSGVSDVKAYEQYLQVAIDSIKNHSNYRNYAAPQGAADARAALANLENVKFNGSFAYTADDFCITEGATGAISSLFEYLKRTDPSAEVLIPCPSYYVFRLCATQHDIAYKEVAPQAIKEKQVVPMEAILNSITPKTKLIALTQPSNPAGEIYSADEVRMLLQVASEKSILVLADELFADLIMYENYEFTPTDKIAHELGSLKNVVMVKAYSKNRNLPGFRIGYIYSTDKKLIEGITKAQEQRAFCASGSNFKELIILDSFYQTVTQFQALHKLSVEQAIEKVLGAYHTLHIHLPVDNDDLRNGYIGFLEHMSSTLSYYRKSFEVVKVELGEDIDFIPNTQAAFNTVVRMEDLDKVNMFDFCLNLFLFYGVKTQVGPYFGFTQKEWEDDLGFWLRISFSMEPEYLREAAKQFVRFKQEYLQHPGMFLHLGICYNK